MTYATLGKDTSQDTNLPGLEITNVSPYGFWVLLGDEELFLPFEEFPWFRDAQIKHLVNAEMLSPDHLYWPDLDVDLTVDSIRHPDQFPLISNSGGGSSRPKINDV